MTTQGSITITLQLQLHYNYIYQKCTNHYNYRLQSWCIIPVMEVSI